MIRKSSLKDLIRNKSNHKPNDHLGRYNSGNIHHSQNVMNSSSNNHQSSYGQGTYVHKYSKKSNILGAAIYKENKLGRHG